MTTKLPDAIVAVQDRIIFTEIPSGVTPAGLQLPEKMKDSAPIGKMVSIGPMALAQAKAQGIELKEDLHFIFDPRMVVEVNLSGAIILAVRYSDIIAVLPHYKGRSFLH